MASQRSLFTASHLQTYTYLLAVCPFSIAFLVFMNASISFVVTDLLGIHEGEGDAVGTLGFADELLALAACPLWGVLSDRIGVRQVCTAGYGIIAISLVLFVQAKNVYPQLLLGRLLFSIGAAAVSTMVTAVLPVVTQRAAGTTVEEVEPELKTDTPSSRLAGFVGMCAGCGALFSLVIFLPLPTRFQQWGFQPPQAMQFSYYSAAAVAVLICICCFFGLRNLPGEDGKGWNSLWSGPETGFLRVTDSKTSYTTLLKSRLPYIYQLWTAVTLGFRNRDILVGYLGGFVARASSVGISLFIPLFVNHYYRLSGRCGGEDTDGTNPGDIKRSCHEAYILASILTGMSQLVALIAAPWFGFLSEKSRRYHVPLLFACLAGVAGYTTLALLPSPDFRGEGGNAGIFLVMALVGTSQIGTIVCSLSVLSNSILHMAGPTRSLTPTERNAGCDPTNTSESDEGQPLLAPYVAHEQHQLSQLKGSIAGVYSLYGGAGILLLTKLGGLLFDVLSSAAPFYIMAGFNGVLLIVGAVCGLIGHWKSTA